MYINITVLLSWVVIALIMSIIGSFVGKENITEFFNRLCFMEVFQISVFLTLSYFHIIS